MNIYQVVGRSVGAAIWGLGLGALAAGMSEEGSMAAGNPTIDSARPAIDRSVPAKTERAVFALG